MRQGHASFVAQEAADGVKELVILEEFAMFNKGSSVSVRDKDERVLAAKLEIAVFDEGSLPIQRGRERGLHYCMCNVDEKHVYTGHELLGSVLNDEVMFPGVPDVWLWRCAEGVELGSSDSDWLLGDARVCGET